MKKPDENPLLEYQREVVTLAVQMKRARAAGQQDVVASLQPRYAELKEKIAALERAAREEKDK